jgi:hypothetical protein
MERVWKGYDEMILLKIEAEAMARLLSGRGKKEEGKDERKGRTGGQLGKRTSGWSGQRARAAATSNVSGQFGVLVCETLHLSLAVGRLQAGQLKKKKGKFCCGTLGRVGQFRTPRAHTQTSQPMADRPTAGQHLGKPLTSSKSLQLLPVGSIHGPSNWQKLRTFSLA